jgi:hypothetical protein
MPDLRSELLDIERRADAATGEGWAVARSEDGEPSILVFHADGERTELRVTREVAPATAEDVEFIARSRRHRRSSRQLANRSRGCCRHDG